MSSSDQKSSGRAVDAVPVRVNAKYFGNAPIHDPGETTRSCDMVYYCANNVVGYGTGITTPPGTSIRSVLPLSTVMTDQNTSRGLEDLSVTLRRRPQRRGNLLCNTAYFTNHNLQSRTFIFFRYKSWRHLKSPWA